MTEIIEKIDDIVWGLPLIAVILLTGIALTAALLGRHLRLVKAFRLLFHQGEGSHGEVSNFASLCMALSATIGTGNIVGVATAIALGGPGALFWMVLAAFFGMATKYAEGLLAVKYRVVEPEHGRVLGGPFYYIEKGLGPKWKPLAVAFAIFGVLAGIMGIGTITQINGITGAVETFFQPGHTGGASLSVIVSGALVTIAAALVIIGGVKRIAAVSTVVVPFMAICYIIFALAVLVYNVRAIPSALMLIVKAAFDPAAFTGGAVGSLFVAMQRGVARGIFSNEAGMGSAPIAAAAARTSEPVEQGLVAMIGTFIDTIVVCTMTGLVIVVTDAWRPIPGVEGAGITIEAFTRGLSFLGAYARSVSSFTLMIAILFFAFTTIIGWTFYSEKCLEYLVGSSRRGWINAFRALYIAMVAVGPYLSVSAVWSVADIMNGLMAFPNVIALVFLLPVVVKSTKEYFGGDLRLPRGFDRISVSKN